MEGIEKNKSTFEIQLEGLKNIAGADGLIVTRGFFGGTNSWVLMFDFGHGETEVAVSIRLDREKNHLYLPAIVSETRGQGSGTKVVDAFKKLCAENDLTIIAVEVLPASEEFWIKQGFQRLPEPNPRNDFQYLFE
jgi:GNAT superfamily N-acetyltransferase